MIDLLLVPQSEIQDFVNIFYEAHEEVFERIEKNHPAKKNCDGDYEALMDFKLIIQDFEDMKRPTYYT